MKVRQPRRCCGPCQRWLHTGTRVDYVHGTLWCLPCALDHIRTHHKEAS